MPIERFVVTVSQVATKIFFMFRSERTFADIYVRGEITDLSYYREKGYTYFTLNDPDASLKAVIFDRDAKLPEGGLADGMSVIAHGTLGCYKKGGTYQLVVTEVESDGEGEAAEELKKLRKKLEDEGLFARKRAVPRIPSKICVITAPGKDAVNDLITNIKRRFPPVEINVIPAVVQGADAPDSLVSAVEKANETDADVIIIGRGGGSDTDLSAFSSEKLIRAMYASRIPTISAVGHENDRPLCDEVADKRVSTPSAAAEQVVPEYGEFLASLTGALEKAEIALKRNIENKLSGVNILESRIKAVSPMRRLELSEESIEHFRAVIERDMTRLIEKRTLGLERSETFVNSSVSALLERKERAFLNTAKVIEALSPLAVLTRGYSITYSEGKALKHADDVKKGDKVRIMLSDGTVNAVVESTERKS